MIRKMWLPNADPFSFTSLTRLWSLDVFSYFGHRDTLKNLMLCKIPGRKKKHSPNTWLSSVRKNSIINGDSSPWLHAVEIQIFPQRSYTMSSGSMFKSRVCLYRSWRISSSQSSITTPGYLRYIRSSEQLHFKSQRASFEQNSLLFNYNCNMSRKRATCNGHDSKIVQGLGAKFFGRWK